jgi:hypothetical protein
MQAHEQQLCALLHGESMSCPADESAPDASSILNAAKYHGVLPLLAAEFCRHPPGFIPRWFLDASRSSARERAMYELASQAELTKVIEGLARARIEPLLLKGAGLGYGCYPSPALRPRADTDLLVRPNERDKARRLLEEMGYQRKCGPAGTFVGYQLELHRTDRLGVRHNIDLHWRISNAQSFAWLFSFDELAASAVPAPRLHPLAVRVGNVHALALNLLHRAGNNCFLEAGSGDCLIWHYDVRLLIEQMEDAALEEFRRLVRTKRIGAIVIDGLRHCAERFGSPRLDRLIDRLVQDPLADSGAQLITAGRLQREWLECRAIPRLRDRLSYLAERAFPTHAYMRDRFPGAYARPLPLLYVERIVHGFAKILPFRRH